MLPGSIGNMQMFGDLSCVLCSACAGTPWRASLGQCLPNIYLPVPDARKDTDSQKERDPGSEWKRKETRWDCVCVSVCACACFLIDPIVCVCVCACVCACELTCACVYQLAADGWQSGSSSQMIQYANELLSVVLQEQYTVFLTVGIQPAGSRLHCTHRQGSYLYFHWVVEKYINAHIHTHTHIQIHR